MFILRSSRICKTDIWDSQNREICHIWGTFFEARFLQSRYSLFEKTLFFHIEGMNIYQLLMRQQINSVGLLISIQFVLIEFFLCKYDAYLYYNADIQQFSFFTSCYINTLYKFYCSISKALIQTQHGCDKIRPCRTTLWGSVPRALNL